MTKSEYVVVAALTAAVLAATAVAGDAEAQMRIRKGEYYQGIQRKPYGHYWIWPPADQLQPVHKDKPGTAKPAPKPRKRPAR
ncbi:hypothetical protein ACIQUG_10205 [Ensifer sp. NPDC090286]|uniref:hypothetical protein n=1 Tax=Ensifer sp. NPDC090286 TaxID=3363991 RepID=UPI00383A3C46